MGPPVSVLYPYRVAEVQLPDITDVKNIWVSKVLLEDLKTRKPLRFTPNLDLELAAQPIPDIYNSATLLAGGMKRFLFLPPQADEQLLDELGEFIDKWILDNLKPLAADTNVDFDEYIENTNYPQSRKDALRREWVENGRNLTDKHFVVKQHGKDENYPSYKHARAINSRSDAFKAATGPWFKAIEKEVFKNPWFIKYVPSRQRSRHIYEKLYKEGRIYYSTDYTSFESLFTARIMSLVEIKLYKYMTQDMIDANWFIQMLAVLTGTNTVNSKWFSVKVDATRMSGEMCTSLGNGFSNLMFWLFLCSKRGCETGGFVEGDDGVFYVEGDAPTKEDFERLGLVVKMEKHEKLHTASFCGNIFHPEVCTTLTDPRPVLADFGWLPYRYMRSKSAVHKSLLRCKALSYAHQYPNHPIIGALCDYILRITSGIHTEHLLNKQGYFNSWELDQLIEAHKSTPSSTDNDIDIRNRFLIEELYGVTVEAQLQYEAYFNSTYCFQTIPLLFDAPKDWTHFKNRYMVNTHANRMLDIPAEEWCLEHKLALPIPIEFSDREAALQYFTADSVRRGKL